MHSVPEAKRHKRSTLTVKQQQVCIMQGKKKNTERF